MKKLFVLILVCVSVSVNAQKNHETLGYSQSRNSNSNADYINACVLSWDSHFNDGCAIIRYDGAYSCINSNGDEILPSNRNSSNNQDFSEGLKSMTKDEEYETLSFYGFVDKHGKYVIDDIYTNPSIFSEGLAYIESARGNGFINKQGEMIISLSEKYSAVKPFKDGMAAVRLKDKWGFINKKGVVAVPIKYDNVCDFSEGLAAVELNGKTGFVNKSGIVVVPIKYASISTVNKNSYKFNAGFAVVYKDGYKHPTGMIIALTRIPIDGYYNYLGMICSKDHINNMIIIDKNGNEKPNVVSASEIDGVYINITNYLNNGFEYGVKSLSGKTIVTPSYRFISNYNNGLALVFDKNLKAGYIDNQGRNRITCKYNNGRDFSEGIAAVKKGNKWGYIDDQGKEITPFIFDDAHPCKDGFACVGINNKYGFIRRDGSPLKINISGNTYYMAGKDKERFWKPEDSSSAKYLEKAIGYYRKAADLEHSPSCFKLGYYSYVGAGSIKKNYAEAVKWLKKCQNGKERTNGADYLYLAYCYYEGGYGIVKDETKSFQYFLKGAELKNYDCYYGLTVSYLNGYGCKKNLIEACKYADKLFEYKTTNALLYADCYNKLAYEYAYKKDYTQALVTIDKPLTSLIEKKEDYEKLIKEDSEKYKFLQKNLDEFYAILGNLYDSKGEIYLMTNNIEEALKMWNKAMEYDKDNLDFYKENSELYKQLKAKGKI